MKERTTHFVEGGDAGNKEDQINRLIRRMIKVFTTIFVICSLNRDCFQAEKKEKKNKESV